MQKKYYIIVMIKILEYTFFFIKYLFKSPFHLIKQKKKEIIFKNVPVFIFFVTFEFAMTMRKYFRSVKVQGNLLDKF